MRKVIFTMLALGFGIGAQHWPEAAVGGLFAIAAGLVRTEPS